MWLGLRYDGRNTCQIRNQAFELNSAKEYMCIIAILIRYDVMSVIAIKQHPFDENT